MTSTPRPTALEHKSSAALLDARPTPGGQTSRTGATEVDDETGIVEALVAVTGIRDDVGDVLVPGCFGRTLRERDPRMVLGHDWNRPVGRMISAVELLPGDPRLPRTAPDGSPWPRAAGALRVKARFILGTVDGREAFEVAQAFGPAQNFSIGYKVNKARERGGVRYIYDLDVYEFSPVLHGANRYATQLAVKAAGGPVVETKSTTTARRRLFHPVSCALCGRPAAASIRPLPSGHRMICTGCQGEVDRIGTDAGYLDAADLDALDQLDELTAEQEYDAALAAERPWRLDSDGTLIRDDDAESQGRAWGRDTRRAWGQP